MGIYILCLATFWMFFIPFGGVGNDCQDKIDRYGCYWNAYEWCLFFCSCSFFGIMVNANGMLGHSARFANSLRAIPMTILRISCLSGLIGLICNYIFECNAWFNYSYSY